MASDWLQLLIPSLSCYCGRAICWFEMFSIDTSSSAVHLTYCSALVRVLTLSETKIAFTGYACCFLFGDIPLCWSVLPICDMDPCFLSAIGSSDNECLEVTKVWLYKMSLGVEEPSKRKVFPKTVAIWVPGIPSPRITMEPKNDGCHVQVKHVQLWEGIYMKALFDLAITWWCCFPRSKTASTWSCAHRQSSSRWC